MRVRRTTRVRARRTTRVRGDGRPVCAARSSATAPACEKPYRGAEVTQLVPSDAPFRGDFPVPPRRAEAIEPCINCGRRQWREAADERGARRCAADGGRRTADGGRRMADGGWRMTDGGRRSVPPSDERCRRVAVPRAQGRTCNGSCRALPSVTSVDDARFLDATVPNPHNAKEDGSSDAWIVGRGDDRRRRPRRARRSSGRAAAGAAPRCRRWLSPRGQTRGRRRVRRRLRLSANRRSLHRDRRADAVDARPSSRNRCRPRSTSWVRAAPTRRARPRRERAAARPTTLAAPYAKAHHLGAEYLRVGRELTRHYDQVKEFDRLGEIDRPDARLPLEGQARARSSTRRC